MSTADRLVQNQVFELLEQNHGVGLRGGALPAWMQARLEHALDALAEGRTGEEMIELLRRDSARLGELAELLRVGETRFYRDPPQWEALRKSVLPELARRDRVRALSVGCSSGEESWTLAMLLGNCCASPGAFRVVGMDRSEAALAVGRSGVYAAAVARQLPAELVKRYLEPSGDSLSIVQSLRRSVSFMLRDAMVGPPPGSWEIVVCKNLLIYFGDDGARRLVESLVRSLADDGVLVVARSEVPRLRALGVRARELAAGITVFCG